MSAADIDREVERFFRSGNHVLRLSPAAASRVCREAVAHGLVAGRIEGGILRQQSFEARLDCIWDCGEAWTEAEADRLSRSADEFIRAECAVHDAFTLSAYPFQQDLF